MSLRVALIDDEPLARDKLRTFFEQEPDIDIAAEYGDGEAALAGLRNDPVDLLFLDIRMPGLDGFGLLEAMGMDQTPAVIFTTAYDQFAVKAFEVHALDYLLKPFDRQRFRDALHQAKAKLASEAAPDLSAILQRLASPDAYPKRIAVREPGKTVMVTCAQIQWVEAAGNYLNLHLGDRSVLYRATMNQLETLLDPAIFARIHRSTMVNLSQVVEFHHGGQGDKVVLTNGEQLNVGRNYKEKLARALNG